MYPALEEPTAQALAFGTEATVEIPHANGLPTDYASFTAEDVHRTSETEAAFTFTVSTTTDMSGDYGFGLGGMVPVCFVNGEPTELSSDFMGDMDESPQSFPRTCPVPEDAEWLEVRARFTDTEMRFTGPLDGSEGDG
ncbi:hypothetical protein O4U47_23375 [Nocardiopsis sp. LSu2-4]|uniref:DUF4352 domain-containing protein n=2 Tax=Nocardiopsis suaedae TaxID=3018444 RepID=A0ABT4TT76_9ACTN|nr:hypothetical protein [Nocardiopsis suaedae]